MRRVTTRSGGLAVVAAGAVVMGGAGWLLGPAWAVGGVLAGPFIAIMAYAGLLSSRLHGAARPVPIRRYSSNPIDPVI